MIVETLKKNIPLVYAVIALVFLLLTNTAYLFPLLGTPPEHHYTGAGLEAVGDKFIYFSNVLQGSRGMLLQRNMQTPEAQEPRVFSPVWFAVGMTSKLLHISGIVAYHAWRIALTITYVLLLIYVVRQVFVRERDRVIALLVVLFGAGWSWLYAEAHPEIFASGVHWLRDFQMSPVELYVTEMYPFLTFVQSPLFMVSHIALLACFGLGIAATRSSRGAKTDGTSRMNATWIGALFGANLLLALVHPYDALIMALVFSSWCIWKAAATPAWPPLIAAGAVGLGLASGIAITIALFLSEPALAGWLRQNLTFSPRLAMYLWSFGAFIPLWGLGLFVTLRNRAVTDWQMLMVIWSVAGWIMVYLPIATNRRLSNAWFIPIALVSVFGIQYILRHVRAFIPRTIIVWLLVLSIAGGTLWRTVVYAVYAPTLSQKYESYLDPAIYGVLQHVAGALPPDSVMLVNEPFIAMLTTAYAPVRIFLGHQHQTVDYFLKKQQAEWFFATTTTDAANKRKQQFLTENGIAYVMVYKPSLTTPTWVVDAPYLERVYESEPADIYRVIPAAL